MAPILDGLNSAQTAAVASPAPILQVLAPPGSGKTKTLTARVAYLLAHHGYRPQDVICCTFTIKASREMRERLAKLIGDELQKKLILGTFHSICRRYLVTYGYLIGLKKGFGIADSGDSLAIIKRIVKRLQVGIQPNAARARISHQKAHGVSPDELAAKLNKNSKVLEQREFVQVYREYEANLAASNLLDYDDLLVRCVELLRKHPQCVSNVQAVLVDEFQDTNHIQYELMNLFASQNQRITVVGDPDQSIYGFRSAEIKNLGRMQQLYKDTSIVLLEDNYRSSGCILSSAQDVIEQDSSRPAKKLQPTHSLGTMPVLRKLPNSESEALWIVLEIKRCIALTGKLVNYSDFAILLRSAALSRQIEAQMGKHGIPYRMVGGLRFFDRVEIKLLLDYLRVISQPGNTDALLRIINVPSRKLGDESVNLLTKGAEKAKKPLWDFIKDVAQGRSSTEKSLSKPADNGLCTLVGLIESARQKLCECTDGSSPRKLLDFLIKKLSFREYLKALHGSNEENRWANVEELLTQADDTPGPENEAENDENLPEIQGLEQQQAHPGEEALSRFLANVALSTEVLPQEGEEGEQSDEKVTISTIHAAKGLEWPVVFVPAVLNGIIPHSRAEDSDEERRLLYVAMTRAQALLYLSYPLRQSRDGEEATLSSFLPSKLVEERFRFLGPKINDKIIQEIADILRRPMPGSAAISEGRSTCDIPYDDQWTEDGFEAPDAIIRWDGTRAMGGEPNPKRQRLNQEQSGASTTTYMSWTPPTMNGSNFSVPTTLSLGFSTAREYIATSDSAAEQPPTTKAETKSNAVAASIIGRKVDGLSQKTISGFFGQPSSSGPKSGSGAAGRYQPQGNRRDAVGQTRHSGSSNSEFKSVIPSNLRTYRPQGPKLQSPRPVLEPSDPNQYTWLAASSKPSEGQKLFSRATQGPKLTDEGTSEAGKDLRTSEIKSLSGTVGGARPVATYHTTTMSMVQTGPATTMRRTLGIRRSMNGWADRMKRENNGPSS
ncbi:hypothetical protein CBS115989_8976 [Aspergillus niger]|uniref:DNA 3'-5' helicase n=2 Tax=Aspergillus niger TaxID=5061 RepID=A2QP78_ASPNC|nr:uncharacterized protein An07g08490 [Aspergillus niger]KAI2813925.1 hypothetical protein CBS115989_8976 [Aspergillus niger]KAI2845165.1 hypothetical protein CBS11232_7758 [Aspergillus niger]KAI2871043.1 hypothetical protein CBS115988_8851 [Aspergillus niger]CAK39643.1 unnamed protein product [Aspergillus niger]|eukprot:XP_001391924.1 ATP-dependent DNA helicase [Aspergillus niger CBS 513.88]